MTTIYVKPGDALDYTNASGTAMPVGTKVTWSVADAAVIVGAGVTGDVFGCGVVVEVAAASGDTSARVLIDLGMGTAV